jgi:anti-sigma-K factor RskA
VSRDLDVESLLGAYALDALDERERAEVERELVDHPSWAAEARRLRDAFDEVLEAQGSSFEPPTALWMRIAAELTEPARSPRTTSGDPTSRTTAAPPPVVPLGARRGGRSRPGPRQSRWLGAAAAVAILLAAAAGLVGGRVTSSHSTSHQTTLAAADGSARARLVVDDTGAAELVPADLPVLDGGRTYQLWQLDGPQAISLGLIGDGALTARLTIGGAPHHLALSVEPPGGSVAPTMAVAAGELA